MGRMSDIGHFATRFLFYLWLDQQPWSYGSTQPPTAEQRAARDRLRANWLRQTLLNLGPTFIKLGQFFSTRADLFPAEYIEELSKLQDQVPAFTYEQAAAIIQRELGKPVEKVYANFDPVPMAAASLGQVHRAQLHSGEEVAVKLQRPGLHRLFTIDLGILKSIAEYVQYRTRWGQGGRDWVGIYEECYRTLWEEVDYLNEGRNADTFRRNFRGISEVVAPRIYWRYTSSAILTMEYVPGIKVSDFDALSAAGINRKAIARIGARSYLRQILHHGFFHADPHPGNIAVNSDGAMIFYDFGMMGRMQPGTRESLMLTFSGIINSDANRVVQSMVELGSLAPGSDLGPVRRSVQYMLDTYMSQAFSTYESISIGDISDDLYELTYNQPFRFPATFTFVLRALSSLEALGKSLDSEFNFMEVAQPFAEEIMAQDPQANNTNALLSQFSRQATQFTNTSLNLPQHIETALNKLEQGDIKVRMSSVETERELRQLKTIGIGAIYALVFGALLISATQLLIAGWPRLGGGILFFAVLIGLSLGRLLLFQLERSDPY
ncbi:MAG: AarF/ABC1/UbiB kinase family protein [Cyanothece sp. SIO1E1]|nr:AarF/ABC1/UbiB kinase family protein [Cyanothece sp. SIO1E1]